jgi:hypothetical protein
LFVVSFRPLADEYIPTGPLDLLQYSVKFAAVLLLLIIIQDILCLFESLWKSIVIVPKPLPCSSRTFTPHHILGFYQHVSFRYSLSYSPSSPSAPSFIGLAPLSRSFVRQLPQLPLGVLTVYSDPGFLVSCLFLFPDFQLGPSLSGEGPTRHPCSLPANSVLIHFCFDSLSLVEISPKPICNVITFLDLFINLAVPCIHTIFRVVCLFSATHQYDPYPLIYSGLRLLIITFRPTHVHYYAQSPPIHV